MTKAAVDAQIEQEIARKTGFSRHNVRNTIKKLGGRPRKGHEKPKPKADFNTLELLKSMLDKARERGDSRNAARLDKEYNWFMGQYCRYLMRSARKMFKKR
ncbi:MAG: hypothetical protein HQK98_03545 [Nitrospirae bacterium]|nr:hypothetical protein [Nitrospirota bacterium]